MARLRDGAERGGKRKKRRGAVRSAPGIPSRRDHLRWRGSWRGGVSHQRPARGVVGLWLGGGRKCKGPVVEESDCRNMRCRWVAQRGQPPPPPRPRVPLATASRLSLASGDAAQRGGRGVWARAGSVWGGGGGEE